MPMKRHIDLIMVLMSVCVISVIGLQLFWNYQNYRSTVKNFDHDINEALRVAVDRELDLRHGTIVKQVIAWMSDTSFIQITTNIRNRDHRTAFRVQDRHPYDPKDKGFSMSINHFDQKLTTITPSAKKYFIGHFANNIVRRDLKKGIVYYYTQRLGDSLQHAFFVSKLDRAKLDTLFKKELAARGIHTAFVIEPMNVHRKHPYFTHAVNTSMRRPYEKELIRAGFEGPGTYFIKEMKWVVVGTLVLLVVIIFCFGYTTKTLLSQHKLAELKNSFINNMTHELNTPLSSIKITVEALSTFEHDPKRSSEYLDIIRYQTDKLTDLTDQILNINGLVDRKKGDIKQVDLQALLQDSLKLLSPQLEARGACVTLDLDDFRTDIAAEPLSLLNAISNIMDNALKYNPNPDPRIDIKVSSTQRFVEISIADNGPGIPEEYRHKVFEPFFRVPQGNRHDVKGYGLGLSYVKQVIDAHHGTINLRDNGPHGSIFTIQLPLI